MLIVMNVVTVNEGRAEDFENAFRDHESKLDSVPGFEGFELLRRDSRDEYAVVTRWKDKDAFDAWVKSDAFRKSHQETDRTIAGNAELRTYEVVLNR